MIRVMILDDEIPALKIAENVLRMFSEVIITGVFLDSDELLENLEQNQVELIFLDIKMPGMGGLELAGRIQEISPDTQIIFITAYSDYATEAFEKDALDYIMKPITAERMQKSLDRYKKRFLDQNSVGTNDYISVRSFGRFAIESKKFGIMRFRTAKTEELMAFLLYYHKFPVSKERIIDELWYDRDQERAQSIFYTTLYQLRKDLEAIGLNHAIEYSRREGDGCRIQWTPNIWDYLEFNNGYQKFITGNLSLDAAKHLISTYSNGYLTENGYSWAEDRRNELEMKYSEIIENIADHEVNLNRYEMALQSLKSWATEVPFQERAHAKIIALYLLINNREMANKYYMNIQKMFKEEIGSPIQIDIDFIALNPKALFNL